MFDIVLPEWLYRRLPLLYGACGLGVVLAAERGVATLSGGLLMLAGLRAWQLRRAHRRAPSGAGGPGTQGSAMPRGRG